METVGRGGLGDIEIDHAGPDDGNAVIGIEFDDFIESIESDDNAIRDRE